MHAVDFDIAQPSEYLCSLYRSQSRYRNSSQTDYCKLVQELNTEDLELGVRHNHLAPSILSTVYETQLLLDPSPATAARLINSYAHVRSIHTFLTPQWTYRAGLILLEEKLGLGLQNSEVMDAYGTCLVILDRAALRWQGAKALSGSLRSYVNAGESESTASRSMVIR